MTKSNWIVENIKEISTITFDKKDSEVNILSSEVCHELNNIIDDVAKNNDIKGIVFLSAKKDFILGADISEITSFQTKEDATNGAKKLQELFNKISTLKKTTVAAIHGQCLGGGFELSLACDFRLATSADKTKLALPEIQLGLIPGAGGTQRLPRLVGIQEALNLITTGKRLSAKKAKKIGAVDDVVPVESLTELAITWATQRKKKPASLMNQISSDSFSKGLPKWALEGNPLGRILMQKKAKELVDEKTKGFYPAAYKALNAVFNGFDKSLITGLELEAKLFGELVVTKECRGLVNLYHATTALKKHPYKDAGTEKFGQKKVTKVGVVGAGFMGTGISTVLADKGIKVLLSDPNKASVGRALNSAKNYFNKKLKRKRLKPFEVEQKMVHISPGLDTTGFNKTDIVIEAVFEDIGLKQTILADLEKNSSEDFIFATNTSAIPITDIAKKSKDSSRVIGMHFFSPVEKMPLLEIVTTEFTAPWVSARSIEVGQKMGKQVIVVKDGPGFYTTRVLAYFLSEAALMLEEGIKISTIDKALTDFGFPVGPITLIDEVGIDVGMHVLETMGAAYPKRLQTPKGMAKIIESGRLGRKNSKGFYVYENNKKTVEDESIYSLIDIQKGDKLSSQDIIDRCVMVFVNESARCLEEGILNNAMDGDVGAVFGLGFPPFLGGPFNYIKEIGAKEIVKKLDNLQVKYGARFKPVKIISSL